MLIKKFTKLFSLKSARLVYKVDYKGIDSYKKLEKASKQATNLEEWQEGGDKAQTEINSKCDTARNEYVEKMTAEEKTRTDSVISEYEKREGAEAAKIRQELTTKHKTSDKSKWKAEYDKLWMERVKPIQNEKYAKRDQVHEEVWNEINAVSARMYSLRDTAISQMRAAFAAREKAKEKIGEKVKEVMNRELDDKTRDENKEKAAFAQNLADDGFTNWNTPADYLDSKIDGVELNDKEIENIAMGIAYSLHDKEAGDNDPAKKFMKGLSDKEDAMGGLLDDNGVRISDIQMQLLETLGQKTKTRDQREDARESEAGKLIGAIASDKKIPAHLRGMLLGKLAKGGEKSIKEVQSMYAMLKKVDKEKLAITGHSKGTVALDVAAPLASMYGGYIPAFLMLSAAQGFRDENSLERCGEALVALEDMQHVVKFQEVVAAYSATGVKNGAVEKILAKAKSPGQMRRSLAALKKAVGEAPAGGDRKTPVEKIKKAPGYAEAKKLFAKFQVPFTYDSKLDALANDKKMSAPEFAASLAEVGTRVKNSAEDAELVAAAAKVRTAVNKDIALVNAYQANWDIIGQKRAGYLKIPSVKQFAQISALTPKEVLAEFDKIKNDLAAEKKTVDDNSAKCDKYAKIYGKYKKRGGGARRGGRRAAPRPKRASGPLNNVASKGVEKGVKREWVNVYSEKEVERKKQMNRYNFKKKVQKPPKFNEDNLPKEPGAYRAKKGNDTYVVVVNAGGKKDYYKKK